MPQAYLYLNFPFKTPNYMGLNPTDSAPRPAGDATQSTTGADCVMAGDVEHAGDQVNRWQPNFHVRHLFFHIALPCFLAKFNLGTRSNENRSSMATMQ